MTTDQLVAAGLPLTDRLVLRYLARRPAHIDRDAIRGAANEALVKAARSYDPRKRVPFDAWATLRIQGAMHDEMRRNSYGPRGATIHLLPLHDYDAAGNGTGRARRVTDVAEAFEEDHTGRKPWVALNDNRDESNATRIDLRQALHALPTQDQRIVIASAAGYALRELSVLHNVTESAIWQRKQAAHTALRTRLAA